MTNITISPTEMSGAGPTDEPEGRRVRGRYAPARVVEASRLVQRVWDGDRRAPLQVQEALSTSDFGSLFGNVLDRMLLDRYAAAPQVWSAFARRRVVKDFRPSTMIDVLGGRAILPAVAELTEYPARPITDAEYELKVGKRGARFALSFEAFVNDDLGAFQDLPNDLAMAARNTEDYVATQLVETAGAPNAGITRVTGNPVLSQDAVEAAVTAIGNRRDSEGLPIANMAKVLMVPPALEMTAKRIVNATEVRTADGARTLISGNVLSGAVSIVVNRWLTSATGWYLLPDPNAGRPAFSLGFLRGYETPEIRVKADTGTAVGGGTIAPTDGSFDFDDVQYRVRHILGGATTDLIAAAASDGSGS